MNNKRYSYHSGNSKVYRNSVLGTWDKNKDILLLYLLSLYSSVTQSYLTLCYPMDRSTPGFPVHHQLPEPAQTHVHWVSDAIQPSHPLPSLSPPACNLSQQQGLFQCVGSSYQVPKVLELPLQHQCPSVEYSGLIPFRIDWFDLLAVQDSPESSPTPQFKSINSSVLSFLYGTPLTSLHDYWKNHSFD